MWVVRLAARSAEAAQAAGTHRSCVLHTISNKQTLDRRENAENGRGAALSSDVQTKPLLVTLLVVAITPVVPPLREREKTAQPKEDGRRHARKRKEFFPFYFELSLRCYRLFSA